MQQEYHTAINWLSRAEIQGILESNGFAVYDSDSTDDLREALRANILDSTIDKGILNV